MDKRALRAALAAKNYYVTNLPGGGVWVDAVDVYAALEAAAKNLPEGVREWVLYVTTPEGTRRAVVTRTPRYGWAVTKLEEV